MCAPDRVVLEHGNLGSLNGRVDLVDDRMTSAEITMSAGNGATVRNSTLTKSLIGEGATVDGVTGKVNVGDHSTVVADGR